MASKYLSRLITSFPSLMCDPSLVFAILEVLTLLRRSCENEFTDEVGVPFESTFRSRLMWPFQYNPIYEFHSDKVGITLQLTDNYKTRNEILGQLHRNANSWFELALGRAPIELQSTLQVCHININDLHWLTVIVRNTSPLTSLLRETTLRNWAHLSLNISGKLSALYNVNLVSSSHVWRTWYSFSGPSFTGFSVAVEDRWREKIGQPNCVEGLFCWRSCWCSIS